MRNGIFGVMPKQPTRKNIQKESLLQSDRAGQGEEAIAKLAYELWLQRSCPEGTAEEDWFRAEDLLRAGAAVATASSSQRPKS